MFSPTLPPKSTRIGVLCGGRSTERDVSLRSGSNCLAALKRLGYSNSVLIDVDTHISQTLSSEGIEVAFLALHGKYGEDGCIQGLLECFGIPYTGNGVLASAVGMDKTRTKALLAQAGLPIIQGVTLKDSDSLAQRALLLASVTAPVMVKPATGGSSVGMSKVTDLADLSSAIDAAFAVDTAVLLEPFIQGIDVTVGVVDKLSEVGITPTVLPLLELSSKTESGWYDLEAKYTRGLTEFILPARVSSSLAQAIEEATLKAHQALGCHGLSRTDFVVCPEQETFYILEINTMPGMTDLSDLPFQADAMGLQYDALVALILQSALTREGGMKSGTAVYGELLPKPLIVSA
ncbi:MAG: D-alanine--D-alanine ligase [Vampirovibrionales bacterium]|nr:D-alanine--D-alanine ligase [Vampirovibrionales bacterium]